jgi:hypothetical protein
VPRGRRCWADLVQKLAGLRCTIRRAVGGERVVEAYGAVVAGICSMRIRIWGTGAAKTKEVGQVAFRRLLISGAGFIASLSICWLARDIAAVSEDIGRSVDAGMA